MLNIVQQEININYWTHVLHALTRKNFCPLEYKDERKKERKKYMLRRETKKWVNTGKKGKTENTGRKRGHKELQMRTIKCDRPKNWGAGDGQTGSD